MRMMGLRPTRAPRNRGCINSRGRCIISDELSTSIDGDEDCCGAAGA